MNDPDAGFREKFEALRRSYTERLGERLAEIEAHAEVLRAHDDGRDALAEIRAATHKLAGNAPTFGFAELGKAAQEIEQRCDAIIDGGGELNAEVKEDVAGAVAALRGHLGKTGG